MDLENCVKSIPKRISKVESFLRKNLPQVDSTCARYYEVCVVENKGALLLRYVVLTDESLIITQNPPKTIIQTIKLSHVQDITLVADRGTLIKGGNNNSYICQHIQVLYKETGKSSSKSNSNVLKINNTSEQDVNLSFSESNQDDVSSQLGSVDESLLSRSASISTEDKTILAVSSDLQNGREEFPLVPVSIQNLYEPELCTQFTSTPISSRAPSTTGFLDVSFNHSDDSGLSSGSITSDQQYHKHFEGEKNDSWRNDKGLFKENGGRRVRRRNRRNGGGLLKTNDLEGDDSTSKLFTSGSSGVSSHRSRHHHKENTNNDDVSSQLNNSVLEQRPFYSWMIKDRDTDEETNRRPRSIDNSQPSTFKERLFGRYLNSSSKTSSNSHSGHLNNIVGTSQTLPLQKSDRKHSKLEIVRNKVAELNFYLYRPDSLLINELFLHWNRHTLKCCMELDESQLGRLEQQPNYSLRAAEKILTKANVRDGISLLSSPKNSFRKFSLLLPPLWTLHKNILRYQHLKILCWKNRELIAGLLDVLKHCRMSIADCCLHTIRGVHGSEEMQPEWIEKLSVFAIVMDIFRLLYQSCSTSFFVQSTNNNFLISVSNNSSSSNSNSVGADSHKEMSTSPLMTVARKLLDTIFSFSSILSQPGPNENIQSVIFEPQNFAKAQWLNSPDSKAIKLITIGHNASVSTLYEILSLIHFSPRGNDKASFMASFQTHSTHLYLRQSVTQVINFLSSTRRPMKAPHCVLLYQHVSVLKTLMDNLDSVKTFLRISFCEEFQYFVHGKVANLKIPDRYPIKSKLLLICVELRNEIIQ